MFFLRKINQNSHVFFLKDHHTPQSNTRGPCFLNNFDNMQTVLLLPMLKKLLSLRWVLLQSEPGQKMVSNSVWHIRGSPAPSLTSSSVMRHSKMPTWRTCCVQLLMPSRNGIPTCRPASRVCSSRSSLNLRMDWPTAPGSDRVMRVRISTSGATLLHGEMR